MSLTADDLMQIRSIFREENKSIQDEIQALHNDIKEIYDELGKINGEIRNVNGQMDRLEKRFTPDKEFAKLSLEDKLQRIYDELMVAAKEAGVALPR